MKQKRCWYAWVELLGHILEAHTFSKHIYYTYLCFNQQYDKQKIICMKDQTCRLNKITGGWVMRIMRIGKL